MTVTETAAGLVSALEPTMPPVGHALTRGSESGLEFNPLILRADPAAVQLQDLIGLIHGQNSAVVIPKFIPAAQSLSTAEALQSTDNVTGYANLRDAFTKVGHTLFEAVVGAETDATREGWQLDRYLAEAARERMLIEDLCRPFGEPPLQQILRLLNQVAGAEPLMVNDRQAFAGLVRIVTNGNQLLPHTDLLAEDMPRHEFGARLRAPGSGQLAVNIYLSTPEEGGELDLWGTRHTPEELLELRLEGSDYGADRAKLPPPAVRIKPGVGDAIFFDSTRLHAVTESSGRPRVSISFFVGFAADGEVRFWS